MEAVLFTVFHDNQENTRIRNAYVPTKPEIPKTRSRVPSAIRLGLTATEDFMRVESVTSSSWSASTEYARSEPAIYIYLGLYVHATSVTRSHGTHLKVARSLLIPKRRVGAIAGD